MGRNAQLRPLVSSSLFSPAIYLHPSSLPSSTLPTPSPRYELVLVGYMKDETKSFMKEEGIRAGNKGMVDRENTKKREKKKDELTRRVQEGLSFLLRHPWIYPTPTLLEIDATSPPLSLLPIPIPLASIDHPND